MTEIQIYRNTAGNVRPSQIARDMGVGINAELFFKNGRAIAGLLINGLIAVRSDTNLKIPPYLRRTHVLQVP